MSENPMSVSTPALLDRFVPQPDVRGRHETTIHAPAALVMEVARNFDIESLLIVRTLFRMRAALLRAPASSPLKGKGLVEQMLRIGWGCLAEQRDQYFAAGAVCRPWQADPAFSPIDPGTFLSCAEPDLVKIAWTLEAASLGPALTRFATETRVAATDEQARIKFRRYWRKFGVGIVLIRLVLLPALRKQAERRWRAQQHAA
jgi:hypothetical protein